MLDRRDLTIAAVSSAPGRSPVGVIRLSGSEACRIAETVVSAFYGEKLADRRGSRRMGGEIRLDDGGSVPATLYVFRTPHSYTREDLVEIHTLGSPLLLESIRNQLLACGAAPALPGEFTARAFFHGAMDLACAESVAAHIRARSDVQLRAARRMKEGFLSGRILKARDELADLLALVEADIDFAEEPIDFIDPNSLRLRMSKIAVRLGGIARGAESAERISSLPQILLLGPPNAGKSSLLNRLSGSNRSICAAAAGTTRDLLSSPIRLSRGEALLWDAAGIDDSPHEFIARARELTLAASSRMDLVCLVADATRLIVSSADMARLTALHAQAQAQTGKILVVANKIDLLDDGQSAAAASTLASICPDGVVCVSAKTGRGIDALRSEMTRVLGEAPATVGEEWVVLSERQNVEIRLVVDAVERGITLARGATRTIDCADRLAFELREALDALGRLAGAVTTEDLLDKIFANFCIGK